jgi:TIR domain
MPGIFISYRREDSAGHAGRLSDLLASHFGADQVFMDLDAIKPGQDFAKVIDDRIARCDILIALIGKDWLSVRSVSNQRRLDDPADFVRREIATALSRGLVVIPVLVEGMKIPTEAALPADLSKICRLQALTLTDARFQQDAGELIECIERYAVSPISPTISRQTRQGQWKAVAASLFGLGLVIGLVWTKAPSQPPRELNVDTPASNLSGEWTAQVPIGEGQQYKIKLVLEEIGNNILGRVEFPAGSGGIREGHVKGDQISFISVHRPQFSNVDATTRFEGKIRGTELELVMQYDDTVKRIYAHRRIGD